MCVNGEGEERVPSPPHSEKPQEASPLFVDPDRTPSPSAAPTDTEQHCIKDSPAQSVKGKVSRKKKKCLSDIFGHIVGGSKESSAVNIMTGKFHTTTRALREEPKDSPYADLDSVPMLHRPKRTSVSPVQDVDGLVRKEQDLTKAQKRFSEKDSCASSSILKNHLMSKDTKSLGSCNKSCRSTEKHSMTLPASSGLMTRALKAEEETDLKDALGTSQISNTGDGFDKTPTNTPIKTEMSPLWESPSTAPSSAYHTSPKRRARKPDKKLIRNGALTQSACGNSSVSAKQPVKVKTENSVALVTSSPPSSSLLPLDAFQDVKELMFKSLVKEDSSDSEQTVFRPDSNYKYSTFLMVLKDFHDAREKEGKPLTLPPSPLLIKEEPLVIPTSAGGQLLNSSCDGFSGRIKTESGPSVKPTTHNAAVKTKSRTKAIMTADTYHCKEFSLHSRFGSSDKQRRKQRLPAKLKLGLPRLSSDLAGLAYGREFVSGHADLADCGPGSPVTTGPSGSFLSRNSESTVAPKKRWQVVEEAAESKGEAGGEASADISDYTTGASAELDLGVEKQAESDSHFSESSSTAGRTHTSRDKKFVR